MNAVFFILFVLCSIFTLFVAPESFLSALLDGASRSATLCISLLATYSVWLGLMKVWEDSGVSRGVSKLLKPLSKRLFRTDDMQTLDAVSMNLSVNLLGISGAATPYGIKAAALLDNSPQPEYASCMFFMLNATSIQLLPTSIIGVRVALGSAAPFDIVLPTLITTTFSTLLGVALIRICIPPKRKKAIKNTPPVSVLKGKTHRAGARL